MQNIMAKELNIIEQIGFVGANSVTDEEYREFWGESREETLEEMKDFMSEFDAKMEAEVYNQVAEEGQLPKEKEKKVAEAEAGDKYVIMLNHQNSEDWKGLVKRMRQLAEQLSKMLEERRSVLDAVTEKGRSVAKKRMAENMWDVKLVAVQSGTGKTLAEGEPVVIRSVDSPVDDGRIVARVFNPGKKGQAIIPGHVEMIGQEPSVMECGVMVDVGGLKYGDLVGALSSGVKGRKSPKGGGPK